MEDESRLLALDTGLFVDVVAAISEECSIVSRWVFGLCLSMNGEGLLPAGSEPGVKWTTQRVKRASPFVSTLLFSAPLASYFVPSSGELGLEMGNEQLGVYKNKKSQALKSIEFSDRRPF